LKSETVGAEPKLDAVTPRRLCRGSGVLRSGIDESPDPLMPGSPNPPIPRTLESLRRKCKMCLLGRWKKLKTSEREPVQSVARQTNSKMFGEFQLLTNLPPPPRRCGDESMNEWRTTSGGAVDNIISTRTRWW